MHDNELYHYRTKGSKNGVSTDPDYIPIGKRAQPAWMPGSDASRQYREDRQQQARMQAEENIKRIKSAAVSTANSGISRVNSAASKAATMAEDARIKRELARREAEKKRQQWVQDRKDAWNRGVSNIKSGLTSTANEALKKSGVNLRISNKRGVTNPYEQGITDYRRATSSYEAQIKKGQLDAQRKRNQQKLHENQKAGKYGRLAQAKAYGKEGFEAASRMANEAKKNLSPSELRRNYWKVRAEVGRTIADVKQDASQSEQYKSVKKNVERMADSAKRTMDKANKKTYAALENYTGLNKSRKEAEKNGPKWKQGRAVGRATRRATYGDQISAAISKSAQSVSDEAERLKKKGLAYLKKFRK